jgi:two-component system, OmpR family, response regulator CpxR
MERLLEKILVIDDDRSLCDLLVEYLHSEGFDVDVAYEGDKGLEMVLGKPYSLVVLDVMLPRGCSGFSILQQIRARSDMPVLMLTARGEDVDRIVGLEMGADDYLPKPFNPRELIARIRAILRRIRHGQQGMYAGREAMRCRVGDVILDSGTRTVVCADQSVDLTSVEFNILEILLRNVGSVVTREELSQEVLERPFSAYDRSIDVHVSKLRKKLGLENTGIERIKAIRGAGYIYVYPPSLGEGGVLTEMVPEKGSISSA